MTRRHREARGAKDAAEGERGAMLLRAPVQALLAQKGCEGLRIYYARDEKDVPTVVVVGVDQEGNDLVGGEVLEWAYPCPPVCGDPNVLNS
jgi:hypothetical protein